MIATFNFLGCSILKTPNPTLHPESTRIEKHAFGTTSTGLAVEEYVLSNAHGVRAGILSWGGILRTLEIPDRNHDMADVVLGFDSLVPYEAQHPYFGTITGRFANRIAKGQFTLDGEKYTLATNNGPNHLHGGINGFDRKVWKAYTSQTHSSASLTMTYTSPDGDEGYPGELKTEVSYTLNDANELTIEYRATTTKPTPINLTNHAYYNLAGHTSGDILNHSLEIDADAYIPVDETSIPLGLLQNVSGTPFDFKTPHTVGDRITQVGIGYDHNYVLSLKPTPLKRAALLTDKTSGRTMEVLTTEPGVQLYTGNYLDGTLIGKGGAVYQKHAGLCLETQHFPDSVHQPTYPTTILRPGEVFTSTTVMRFGVTQ
jgi:aldose 1-epimerase